MSFSSLLNQELTYTPKTGYDAYGRETTDTSETLKCRFQRKTKQRLAPNNTLITIDAIVFVKTDTDIQVGDKITYDGADYRVVNRYDSVDGAGDTHHLTLEVAKWLI